MLPETLVTHYLEMNSRAEFRPAYVEGPFSIAEMVRPDVAFYRFLYREVGAAWRWRDRLELDDATLRALLDDPQVTVDVLYVEGVPAGYIELRHDEDTEIVYYGLRREFQGCGFGKHLLSHGVARAWVCGAKRVWLHTCNLDSPYALENYLKRGFRVCRVEETPMPEAYR